ncbi:unnamed protein product [marine sediment metagenome]|uniref:Uncharacterized protein n=1 Tax=marine sediment metagenome TaxID=412755 RepID=X0YU03_9ZZZZ
MAGFIQAIKWIKEGKHIRRKVYPNQRIGEDEFGRVSRLDEFGHCVYRTERSFAQATFKLTDFEAEDWIVIVGKKEQEATR